MESCWVLVQHNGIEIIMNEIDFDRFSDAQGKARLAKRFRCLEHWFDRNKALREHPKATSFKSGV